MDDDQTIFEIFKAELEAAVVDKTRRGIVVSSSYLGHYCPLGCMIPVTEPKFQGDHRPTGARFRQATTIGKRLPPLAPTAFADAFDRGYTCSESPITQMYETLGLQYRALYP